MKTKKSKMTFEEKVRSMTAGEIIMAMDKGGMWCWYIVVAMLPSGQISNHYNLKDWDLFNIPEVEIAKYPFGGQITQ